MGHASDIRTQLVFWPRETVNKKEIQLVDGCSSGFHQVPLKDQVQFEPAGEFGLSRTIAAMEQRRVRRRLEDILDVKRRTLSDDWERAHSPSSIHGPTRPESPEYRSHTPECPLGRSPTPGGGSHVHVITTTVYSNKGFSHGRPRTPGGRPLSPEAGKQYHHYWEVRTMNK